MVTYRLLLVQFAVRTRLELATSCVTGRHSNQTELPDLSKNVDANLVGFHFQTSFLTEKIQLC